MFSGILDWAILGVIVPSLVALGMYFDLTLRPHLGRLPFVLAAVCGSGVVMYLLNRFGGGNLFDLPLLALMLLAPPVLVVYAAIVLARGFWRVLRPARQADKSKA